LSAVGDLPVTTRDCVAANALSTDRRSVMVSSRRGVKRADQVLSVCRVRGPRAMLPLRLPAGQKQRQAGLDGLSSRVRGPTLQQLTDRLAFDPTNGMMCCWPLPTCGCHPCIVGHCHGPPSAGQQPGDCKLLDTHSRWGAWGDAQGGLRS
jgi:hypothetical protein